MVRSTRWSYGHTNGRVRVILGVRIRVWHMTYPGKRVPCTTWYHGHRKLLVFWQNTRQPVERGSECRATHTYTLATALTPLPQRLPRKSPLQCTYRYMCTNGTNGTDGTNGTNGHTCALFQSESCDITVRVPWYTTYLGTMVPCYLLVHVYVPWYVPVLVCTYVPWYGNTRGTKMVCSIPLAS
jgi:hypothetical protein